MSIQPVTLSAGTDVDLPVSEVFALFGRPEATSWLFGARCDRVAVGAAVRIRLPIESHGGFEVELFGRFARVRSHSLIVIAHEQPWRGEMRIMFDAIDGTRTRVRVRAGLDATGIDWLVRRIGLTLPDPTPTNAIRIGLLTSKSGPAAVYAMGVEHMAELAIDEINTGGGVNGRPLEILVADDATEPGCAATEAARMGRAGCRAIFACTTSASFTAATGAVHGRDILMVQPVINEGGDETATVVRFGERPGAQVAALADPVMEAAGGTRWFMVGQQYSWSYGAHRTARRVLSARSGRVVGQHFTPLGTSDFSSVIEQIDTAGTDIVLSSLIGADEVAFQRQCAQAGLRQRTTMLSLVMDESTYEHIGDDNNGEIFTALGYFENAGEVGNRELIARYRDRYGRWAPPVTALSETVYEAVLHYARALTSSPDGRAAEHARSMRALRASMAIGNRDLTSQRLYLARAHAGTLRIFDCTER